MSPWLNYSQVRPHAGSWLLWEWPRGVESVRGYLQKLEWHQELSDGECPEAARAFQHCYLGHDCGSTFFPLVHAWACHASLLVSLMNSLSIHLFFVYINHRILLLTSKCRPHSVDRVAKSLNMTKIQKTGTTASSLQKAWVLSSKGGDLFLEQRTKEHKFISPGCGHLFLRQGLNAVR